MATIVMNRQPTNASGLVIAFCIVPCAVAHITLKQINNNIIDNEWFDDESLVLGGCGGGGGSAINIIPQPKNASSWLIITASGVVALVDKIGTATARMTQGIIIEGLGDLSDPQVIELPSHRKHFSNNQKQNGVPDGHAVCDKVRTNSELYILKN
ncbi:MAG: hypothetical protein Q8L12_02930 [Methylibium sp.]|nr:hypothetical protein [Methylibium sp.]